MKTFSSADKNWAVQISTVKGSACAKTKKALPIRKLTIEKHTNNKKKRLDQVLKVIESFKLNTNVEAENEIMRVKQWQQNTCSRFDMIEQVLIRQFGLDAPSSSSKESSIDQPVIRQSHRNKRITHRRASAPSMPIIMDDDEDEAISPDSTIPKRMTKPRKSNCSATFDFSVRKKSHLPHSSVLAITSESPILALTSEPQDGGAKSPNSPKPKTVASVVNGNEKSPPNEGDSKDVFRKFLEARKLILQQREKEEAASKENAAGGPSQG